MIAIILEILKILLFPQLSVNPPILFQTAAHEWILFDTQLYTSNIYNN